MFDSECNARANRTQSSLLVLLRCSRVSPTVKSPSRDLKMKTRFQFPENSFLISGGKGTTFFWQFAFTNYTTIFTFCRNRSFIYKIMCIFAAKSQNYGTIFSIFYRFLWYQLPSVAPHLHAPPLYGRGGEFRV